MPRHSTPHILSTAKIELARKEIEKVLLFELVFIVSVLIMCIIDSTFPKLPSIPRCSSLASLWTIWTNMDFNVWHWTLDKMIQFIFIWCFVCVPRLHINRGRKDGSISCLFPNLVLGNFTNVKIIVGLDIRRRNTQHHSLKILVRLRIEINFNRKWSQSNKVKMNVK